MNFIKDSLWFGEQMASSLSRGGITRRELAQQWRTSGLKDEERKFSRDVFRNILQEAEELFDCVFICERQSNRWTVEGGKEEEERFIRKVEALRLFMKV